MKRRRFLIGAGVAALFTRIPNVVAQSNHRKVSVADFLDRFGETDAAIQGAIDQAIRSGASVVLLPALHGGRAYEVRRTIQNNGVQLVGDGPGSIVRKIGRGSCFVSGYVPSTNIARITTEIAAGTDRIKDSACAGIELRAGAVYVLTSEGRCHPNTPAHCGEFVVVKAASNGIALLERPLLYSYRPTEDACVRDAGLVGGVGYRELRIEMDPAVVPTSALTRFDNYGIQLDFCRSPLVRGVSISDGVAAGVRLLGCIDARIVDYRASDLGSAEDDQNGSSTIGPGGYGYGIAERGLNRGLVVERAVTDQVRHLYTSGAEWPDVFKYGMPIDSLITNSTSKNAKGACFDTHETGINITFENCHAEGGRAVGFQLRSKNAKVVSCTARNLAGAAVWVYGADVHSNAAGDGCLVSGLQCDNVNGAPPTVYSADVDWRDTGAILDQGFGNEFRSVRVEDCAGPALTVAAAARGGIYRDFDVSKVCQSTLAKCCVIDVEQISAEAAPRISGIHVSDSPRVKAVMSISNENCRPEVSDIVLS
jgi:hypothetical protein